MVFFRFIFIALLLSVATIETMRAESLVFLKTESVAVSQEYELWKDKKIEHWRNKKTNTLAIQLFDITANIAFLLKYLAQNSDDFCAQKLLWYAYRFMRELLKLDPIASLQEVDKQWLKEVKSELEPYVVMEQQAINGIELKVPSHAQTKFIEQSQEFCELKKPVITLISSIDPEIILGGSHTSWAQPIIHLDFYEKEIMIPIQYIALVNNADLNRQKTALYHEFGHVFYEDVESVSWGNVSSCLTELSLVSAVERANYYLTLGEDAFNDITDVGKHVNKVLEDFGIKKKAPQVSNEGAVNRKGIPSDEHFWITPKEKELYQMMLYRRGTEKRADLFMLDKLFAQNEINAILQNIIDSGVKATSFVYTQHPSIIVLPPCESEGSEECAKEIDWHPSCFERALYMTGFLVDKGIDVNKLLEEWNLTGTCVNFEGGSLNIFIQDILQQTMLSQGARDFRRAYGLWQEEQLK